MFDKGIRKLADFVVEQYKVLLIAFAVACLLCAFLSTQVRVNYKLSDYLPDEMPSVQAIQTMEDEFQEPIPNLRIALTDASVPEVLNLEERLREDPEVELVLWLDNYESVEKPLEVIDPELLESYYQKGEEGEEGTALISVAVSSDNEYEALERMKDLVGREAHYDGALVTDAFQQISTESEIGRIISIIVPICVVILLLVTNSWMDPVLMLSTIGVAIVLNNGTNIIFRDGVSFLTQSVSAILQLAVSMDYTIFFLDAWMVNKKAGYGSDEALERAIVSSSEAVVSSALTTVFGFIVLAFMRFKLGADLGFVLAKGIAFSLIAVIFFLPCLIKVCEKYIVRFFHPPIFPKFKKVSAFVVKNHKKLLWILVLLPIVFIAQMNNSFTYGPGEFPKKSQIYKDQVFIDDHFEANMPIVVLAPSGQWGKEKTMIRALEDQPMVQSVLSYTELVSEALPFQIVPPAARSSFLSENYSRIIMNTTSPEEGEKAFQLVEGTRDIAHKYYGDEAYVLGQSVTMLDMKNTVTKDNRLVNFLAILSIAIVIGLTFKSLLLPLILVLTIEFSIWVNMSVPFFRNTKLSYIGYLIISSIQLGATVDYAILYTSNYLSLRQKHPREEAIYKSGVLTYSSIVTPAIILTVAGLLLYGISSLAVVSELGTCLGRGASLSLLMVIFLLPALIYQLDPHIERFTKDANFYHLPGEEPKGQASSSSEDGTNGMKAFFSRKSDKKKKGSSKQGAKRRAGDPRKKNPDFNQTEEDRALSQKLKNMVEEAYGKEAEKPVPPKRAPSKNGGGTEKNRGRKQRKARKKFREEDKDEK